MATASATRACTVDRSGVAALSPSTTALSPIVRTLLAACGATLGSDAGGATRLVDLGNDSTLDHEARALLDPAQPSSDTARRVAWLGVSPLDASRACQRRLRDAAAAVGPDGLAIVVAVADARPLPSGAQADAIARRSGWRHLQYWIDAPARHAVHVLERLPH